MSKIPEKLVGEVAILTNLIHSLSIIQEGYIKEIEGILRRHGSFRYQFKNHVNVIKKKTEEMRSEIYKANSDTADVYGQLSDRIEDGINELILDVKQQLKE
jgi:hypothetical protein